jgi:eukaryotic-like serine/threonine-protein kinase
MRTCSYFSYDDDVADDDDTETQQLRRPRLKRTKLGVGEVLQNVPRADLVGQLVLDRYIVETEVGAGAMGRVYRGRHTKLGRNVAIKVLHDEYMHEPTMVERFRREAMVAARLSHGNVAGVLDVGETRDGAHLIVLEFAKGASLRDLMDDGPLPGPRVIALVKGILRGLDHAHSAGLIHRDLKPENVIVEVLPDGTEVPRIVDFGIAVLKDPEETTSGGKLTASGVIVGTPLYMAPEQAKGEAIDQRIDLFSLGVIVFELLSGTQPFTGTAMEIALANIGKDPPPIAKRVPGVTVDPLLELFMRKLMARRLDRRFASAHAALEVLEQLERDPAAAQLALGRIDVAKALAVVSLPDPKPR